MAQAYRREFGCDFISAMPTNLYGPADNFDVLNGHVLPSLLRRLHEAKTANAPEIVIWGTGAAQREFLHADDCADALTLLMNRYSDEEPVNVGSGEDISILELTHMVAEVVGYAGAIRTDPSKPDGPPRKLLSVTKLPCAGLETAYYPETRYLAHLSLVSRQSCNGEGREMRIALVTGRGRLHRRSGG